MLAGKGKKQPKALTAQDTWDFWTIEIHHGSQARSSDQGSKDARWSCIGCTPKPLPTRKILKQRSGCQSVATAVLTGLRSNA
ncbi:MAG: Uncharacterised protein [Gammaproteobacteria bacterium]|nr:MAG: Uncharacterised protein [Gammaproteobacteria bacterium]